MSQTLNPDLRYVQGPAWSTPAPAAVDVAGSKASPGHATPSRERAPPGHAPSALPLPAQRHAAPGHAATAVRAEAAATHAALAIPLRSAQLLQSWLRPRERLFPETSSGYFVRFVDWCGLLAANRSLLISEVAWVDIFMAA